MDVSAVKDVSVHRNDKERLNKVVSSVLLLKLLLFLFVVLLVVMAACGGKKETSVDAEQLMFQIDSVDHVTGLAVALEEVQDPGNLGTIIRLCDWLGIQHLFCSKGCADPFNTKTVQASMGALGNVTIHEEVDLLHYLPHHFDIIMATAMKGVDYRKASVGKSDRAVLLLGNEGRGLSEELLQIATTCLTIPSAPSAVSDSLNVSISAAILKM